MGNLKRLSVPELDRLEGFLDAARHVFIRGQLHVTLGAALFGVAGDDIVDEDIIRAAYPRGYNPIEYRDECSVDEMVSGVHNILTIAREFWRPERPVPEVIERELRERYWRHVKACLDYTGARIVELGHHAPYVNIWGGFTYILYAPDMSRCLLLVGNTSD